MEFDTKCLGLACISCIIHHSVLIAEGKASTRTDCVCFELNTMLSTFEHLLFIADTFGHKKLWICHCEMIHRTFHEVTINLNLIITINFFKQKKVTEIL